MRAGLPTTHQPPATTHYPLPRRGISLLEVLISMFVLAVGLLGVAALIPAGRYEIAVSSRLENSAMIGRAAFRDLQIRDYLDMRNWRDANGNRVWRPFAPGAGWDAVTNNPTYHPPVTYDNGATYTDQVRIVFDPLGVAAGYGDVFPFGAPTTEPYLARLVPNASFATTNPAHKAIADLVFRASHDLITTENGDLPPIREYLGANERRASDGNYSWLATIVTDPTFTTNQFTIGKRPEFATVSVVVFHKRNLSMPGAGEFASLDVLFSGLGAGVGGGEMVFKSVTSYTTPPQKVESVRPGQWVMLAGRRDIGAGAFHSYFRWYRVVASKELESTGLQTVTLAGADWHKDLGSAAGKTRAFVFDNIVAVYEKNIPLEIE